MSISVRPPTSVPRPPSPQPPPTLPTRHTNIVKYKTAFYSFYLPVAMAMLMAGVKDEQSYRNAQDILLEMGIFFQVQDDYLDCYGDPAVIGKIGTDIQDNKCGWLVVQALKLATPEQRQLLEVGRNRGAQCKCMEHDSATTPFCSDNPSDRKTTARRMLSVRRKSRRCTRT